jgi:hypothetical protein
MGSNAKAGHGAKLAFELDPVGSPGTFTVVGEMQDITRPEMSRGETEVTPHNQRMDAWVLSKRILRSPIAGTVNFVNEDPTHDHLTGLQSLLIDGTRFGVQVLGPDGVAATHTHELIGSAEVQSFGPITYPVREGVMSAPFSLRMINGMWIDGVLFE